MTASGAVETSIPLLPGGFGRSTFAVGSPDLFASGGYGYTLVEEDGSELVDLSNNYTVLIHGHAHPAVVEAGQRALADGACFGLGNTHELEHAQCLIKRMPWMEQVRYSNSGTEAIMTAVRVARAHTGREKIILVRAAFHGTGDAVLPSGGEWYSRGIPAGVQSDALIVTLNDVAELEETVATNGGQVAAILLDMIPNQAGLTPLTDAFLEAAQELARTHGMLIVADEVVGFRLEYGGISAARGLSPDLVVLGKMIGGGMGIGAVVGRNEVMANLDPSRPDCLVDGGSFAGNPVSMATGAAALTLFDEPAIDRLNALGARARKRLAELASERWEVRGQGSLLRPITTDPGVNPKVRGKALWAPAYRRGILLMETGFVALSTPMTDDVVDDAMSKLADAMAEVDAEIPLEG